MIDRLVLNINETAELDTTNNSITILVCNGSVNVTKEAIIIATLGQYEIYTLPINTGIYCINAVSDNTIVYIFRTFVY